MGELLPQAAFLCLPCSFTVCVCTWDVFLVCFSAFSAFFFPAHYDDYCFLAF